MLEEQTEYKRLVLKRDLLWTIVNLRTYKIMGKKREGQFEDHISLIRKYDNPAEKFRYFLDCYREGLVGFDNLDVSKEDWDNVDYLAQKYPDEKEKIYKLVHEIIDLMKIRPKIEWLPLELMTFIPQFYDFPITQGEMESIIEDILKAIPYKMDSKEYQYLMEHSYQSNFFEAYFKKQNIPKEENQENFRRLINRLLNDSSSFAPSNSMVALKTFIDAGAHLTLEIMDDILDSDCQVSKKADLAETLSAIGTSVAFDIEEYIRKKIEEAEIHDDVEEDSKSTKKVRIAKVLADIVRILIPLVNQEELMMLISRQLLEQYEALNTASTFSSFLHEMYTEERYGDVFDRVYLDLQDELETQKQEVALVMTLKAIEEKAERITNTEIKI